MPKASVTRLISKKKDKLIEFVLDIDKYQEFIPFCLDSKVYEKKQSGNMTLIIATHDEQLASKANKRINL